MLGVGVSGPQVVEGWYGQSFPKPMARTREFITLLRQMWDRQGPVIFQGEHYQLPLQGGAGMGKPFKLINKPLRDRLPIYLGAAGPKNIETLRRRGLAGGAAGTHQGARGGVEGGPGDDDARGDDGSVAMRVLAEAFA